MLDFMDVMHEDVKFSEFNIDDGNDTIYISPITIKSDFLLENYVGKTYISADKIVMKNINNSTLLNVEKPNIYVQMDSVKPKGPIYGKYYIESDSIKFYKDKKLMSLILSFQKAGLLNFKRVTGLLYGKWLIFSNFKVKGKMGHWVTQKFKMGARGLEKFGILKVPPI